MDNLISGLVGALLATVIAVVYSHISELKRRRYDVTLDVVGYSDDIYCYLQTMQTYKNEMAAGASLPEVDEYHAASKELRILVLSNRIHARVALVYGERSSELKALQTLRGHYIDSARLLWRSGVNNWSETNDELLNRFRQIIDPLRESIETQFIKSVKIRHILKDGVLNICGMPK